MLSWQFGPFHRSLVMLGVRPSLRLLFSSLACCLFAAAFAVAQEDAEDSPYKPGLIASYAAADKKAVRTDEVIAFDWQNAACDPRLPAGEFTAAWRGRLWARGAGSYTIACYLQGEVAVKVA